MTNPNLTSEFQNEDPDAVWQQRQPYQNNATATGSDNSTFSRSIVNGGQIVSTQSDKAQRGSSSDVPNEANAAARVPYLRAEDPVYRCPQTPDQVTDDSVLTFPDGSQCTARDARLMGWLAPAATRQPTPTEGAPQQSFNNGQEQQQEEVHPDLQMDALADEAADRDFSALVDSTGGVEQLDAIKQIVQDGQIDARTLGTLASQLGVEPEQLAARTGPIMQAFEQQARSVMSVGGLDSSDVVAYAQQNCPDKLRSAMHKQATMRQTSGYAEIRQEYLAGLGEHNPSAALNAELGNGITQYQDTKGRVMVRIPGMSDMLWSTAIKSFGVSKS